MTDSRVKEETPELFLPLLSPRIAPALLGMPALVISSTGQPWTLVIHLSPLSL